MITKGGLKLGISEKTWEHAFSSSEDKEKAEKILQTLAGMSIFSASNLLDECKLCLKTVIIPLSE